MIYKSRIIFTLSICIILTIADWPVAHAQVSKSLPNRSEANKNTVKEIFTTAWQLYSGSGGYIVNKPEALLWFKSAAESGHTLSSFLVGYVRFYGQGSKQDYSEASKWQ
jgi:TPR repeat protein